MTVKPATSQACNTQPCPNYGMYISVNTTPPPYAIYTLAGFNPETGLGFHGDMGNGLKRGTIPRIYSGTATLSGGAVYFDLSAAPLNEWFVWFMGGPLPAVAHNTTLQPYAYSNVSGRTFTYMLGHSGNTTIISSCYGSSCPPLDCTNFTIEVMQGFPLSGVFYSPPRLTYETYGSPPVYAYMLDYNYDIFPINVQDYTCYGYNTQQAYGLCKMTLT